MLPQTGPNSGQPLTLQKQENKILESFAGLLDQDLEAWTEGWAAHWDGAATSGDRQLAKKLALFPPKCLGWLRVGLGTVQAITKLREVTFAPVIVSVSGGSNSGKTSVVRALLQDGVKKPIAGTNDA